MISTICIGRDSRVTEMRSQLQSLGYDLDVVGSVHEYLRYTEDLREHIIMVGENFDASAQESIAHWVRYSARPTKIIFLYDHHIDRVRGADAIANVCNPENVFDALAFVRLGELAVA